MAITSPTTVVLSKPPSLSLAEVLAEFRNWLDRNRVEPVTFKEISFPGGGVGFEIWFRYEHEAQAFDKAFG